MIANEVDQGTLDAQKQSEHSKLVDRNPDGTWKKGHKPMGTGRPKRQVFKNILASLPEKQRTFYLDDGTKVTAEQYAVCRHLDLIADAYWPAIKDFHDRVFGKPVESVHMTSNDDHITNDPEYREKLLAELKKLRAATMGEDGED